MATQKEFVTSLKLVAEELDIPYAKVLQWRDELGCPHLQKAYSISAIRKWVTEQHESREDESGAASSLRSEIHELGCQSRDLLVDLLCDPSASPSHTGVIISYSETSLSFLVLLHWLCGDARKLGEFQRELRRVVSRLKQDGDHTVSVVCFEIHCHCDLEMQSCRVESIMVDRSALLNWSDEGDLNRSDVGIEGARA